MKLEEILSLKSLGKKIVFTNGVFDILHAGHVSYLIEAKKLGDVLIVAMNTDHSVRSLNKGPNRPIHCLEDRTLVLESLKMVDGVIPFDAHTPLDLIKEIRPEVYVKGGDYSIEKLVEAQFVKSYGGEVVFVPLLEGRSTTLVLKKEVELESI